MQIIKHFGMAIIGFIAGWILGTILFVALVADYYRSIERGRFDTKGGTFKVRVARRIRR